MTPQRFNILLVDDTVGDARLFEMALREVAPRITVFWVATGEEALQALRRTNRFIDLMDIDIVVMDLQMPISNGLETLERIRKDPQLAGKPVIIMSNSRDRGDVQRCYAMGANSFFVKPLTLEGTQEMLRVITRYWLELAALPDLP